jgi:ubiquitin carboxyl-terminal hydrolase 4/11/15
MVSTDKEIDAYMATQESSADVTLTGSSQKSAPSSCSPEHLSTINSLKNKPLVKGNIWFLVARAWLRKWEHACSNGANNDYSQDVGPVDNSSIADTTGKLSLLLTEGVDIEFVPELAWNHLVEWWVRLFHHPSFS